MKKEDFILEQVKKIKKSQKNPPPLKCTYSVSDFATESMSTQVEVKYLINRVHKLESDFAGLEYRVKNLEDVIYNGHNRLPSTVDSSIISRMKPPPPPIRVVKECGDRPTIFDRIIAWFKKAKGSK